MGKKIHASDQALEILDENRSNGQSYSGVIIDIAEKAGLKEEEVPA